MFFLVVDSIVRGGVSDLLHRLVGGGGESILLSFLDRLHPLVVGGGESMMLLTIIAVVLDFAIIATT